MNQWSLLPLIKVLTENILHQYFFMDNVLVIVITNVKDFFHACLN